MEIKHVPMRRDDDCLRAVIATVYGLRYGDTPRIGANATVSGRPVTSSEFWKHWHEWARRRGQELRLHMGKPRPIPDGYWIAVVVVGGGHHAVIFKGRKFFWDPDWADPIKRLGLRRVIAHVELV